MKSDVPQTRLDIRASTIATAHCLQDWSVRERLTEMVEFASNRCNSRTLPTNVLRCRCRGSSLTMPLNLPSPQPAEISRIHDRSNDRTSCCSGREHEAGGSRCPDGVGAGIVLGSD